MRVKLDGYCKDCPFFEPETYVKDDQIFWKPLQPKCKNTYVCERTYKKGQTDDSTSTRLSEILKHSDFQFHGLLDNYNGMKSRMKKNSCIMIIQSVCIAFLIVLHILP